MEALVVHINDNALLQKRPILHAFIVAVGHYLFAYSILFADECASNGTELNFFDF